MIKEELLEEFKNHLLQEGKSNTTVISYTGDVKGFISWLVTKQVAFDGQLRRFYITTYKENLLDNNYTVNTINKKINSLHCFNLFLIEKDFCSEKVVHPNRDKIKVASGSEGEVDVFSEDEVERLLFFLENPLKVNLRNKTVILILIYTGLRVGELVNLKIKDIDLLTMNLKVVGKGGKYREVSLKSEVVESIKTYINTEEESIGMWKVTICY